MNGLRLPGFKEVIIVKQLILIRRDLNMRRGKEISQGAHAAMAFLTRGVDPTGQFRKLTETQLEWVRNSFTKIVLQVDSEDELLRAFEKAKSNNILAHLIVDNGTTEFKGVATPTAVAIGPEKSEILNPLFNNLKLY